MALQNGQIVLIDTNVVIEAHRTGCLGQLADRFCLHTVEAVVTETQAGAQRRRPEQNIDEGTLRGYLKVVQPITNEQRFSFAEKYGPTALDAGERDLLIYADGIAGAWLLNSPDVAVLRFANDRGWLDRVISLDAMASHVNARLRDSLRENYRESWLSQRKTAFMLGSL